MSTERSSTEPVPGPDRFELFTRRLALLTTTVIKLAGVFVGVHGVLQSPVDSRVMILAALMLSGGQLSESVLLAAIDRFAERSKGGGTG